MKVNKHRYLYLSIATLILLFACSKGGENEQETDNDNGFKPVEEEAFAFPEAEGFGRKVTGGRGGRVIKVTNLNDAGTGSLRAAVTASGPRIVVFEVSGTIELQSQLNIRNPHITLAGQTAPGDGITIKNYPVVLSTQNVIIRFMRFRMGDEKGVEADALGGFEQKDIMIDHCSMSWSTDECVSFYSNENFTLQWCVISESLRFSAHDKGAHGYGGIFGGFKASFHHNLIAHHDSRNPRFGERGGTDIARRSLVDYRNNVIYNWGGNSAYGGEGMHINLVNNYYKPGPATQNRANTRIYSIDKSKNPQEPMYDIWGKYYIAGNYFENQPAVTSNNWSNGVYNQFHNSYGIVSENDKVAMQQATPHDIENNVTTHTAQEAYEKVLLFAGASLKRDAVDIRVVDDVANKTYTAHGSSGDQYSRFGIIDSPGDVGGWPELSSGTVPLDTDGDGIPDEWEIANKLDPSKPNADGRNLSTAYDNIEVYINSLVNVKK
ncbi:pectate lyase [Sphingobacterium alkalisoli]|uniref:Pectate lyase n=1 Tax=Sphingobacterium alkalisoli TaxID=1874115 RepID=A0A4U0GX82_9SPHI|nr:pectate lyase [Sphingobacterium alkalisoli]TJY63626.1 pectate lyase [Sphingobacterium alkalisoli]GGH27236.1 pectate lyase [Sphingobacterium alkalisoli]